VIGPLIVGAIVSNRNDFEDSFGGVSDFSQARQVALGENIFGDELSLDSVVDAPQAYRLKRHPSARIQPAVAAFKEIAISPYSLGAAARARKVLKGADRDD